MKSRKYILDEKLFSEIAFYFLFFLKKKNIFLEWVLITREITA